MPTLLFSFDQRRGFATARRYWAPLASAQGTCRRFLLAAGPDQRRHDNQEFQQTDNSGRRWFHTFRQYRLWPLLSTLDTEGEAPR